MKIRAANRLWRQVTRSIGSPSRHTYPWVLELQGTVKGRFISTKFVLDQTTYDVNRDYTSEMTIPGLRYETRAWGRNSEGQLGPRDGNFRQEWDQPQRVKGLENVQVTDVAGSGVVSMALTKDGSVWSWGTSKRGQLGLGRDVIQSKTPQQVVSLAGRVVSQMALGWGHALACTTDGELYAWGYPADGRLGFRQEVQQPVKEGTLEATGLSQDCESSKKSDAAEGVDKKVSEMLEEEKAVIPLWEPRRVEALAHERVKQVACGMDHSLALTETGNLYSFGDNSLGQLGRPQGNEPVDSVKFPLGHSKVLSCAAGLGHSLAIALNPHAPERRPPELVKLLTKWEKDTDEEAQGTLFSWGWNSASQLGRAGDPNLPVLVEGLSEDKLVRLAAGRVHSTGLSSKRQVWTWGSGKNGRLGLDSPIDEPYPFPNEYLGFWRTVQVACGFDHTLILVRTVVHTPGKGSCDLIVERKKGSW
ncbi:unnamed protein product [Calypogeia fissa]